MTTLSERIASLALSTFDALPQKCKPRSFPDGRKEWTPMAAVVIVRKNHQEHDNNTGNNNDGSDVVGQEGGDEDDDLICVSLATGTKCLPSSALPRCRGQVLHDCHAEILALRGFNYWLMGECHRLLVDSRYNSPWITHVSPLRAQSPSMHTPLSSESETGPPFEIRPEVSVHLFGTTAPCGDASMGLLIASKPPENAVPWADENLQIDLQSGQPLGRGHFSLLGAVRRKPARGDAEATLSKSCTDKISLKQVTGVLSFPADLLLQTNDYAFLKSFIVYHDEYNEDDYSRAFGEHGRLKAVQGLGEVNHFKTQVLPTDYRRFEYDRGRVPGSKTTNLSVVSIAGPRDDSSRLNEVLVNGVKQGYRQVDNRPGKASIISRIKMMEKYLDICNILEQQDLLSLFKDTSVSKEQPKYSTLKMSSGRHVRRSAKEKFVTQLSGWTSNSTEDDFVIGRIPEAEAYNDRTRKTT